MLLLPLPFGSAIVMSMCSSSKTILLAMVFHRSEGRTWPLALRAKMCAAVIVAARGCTVYHEGTDAMESAVDVGNLASTKKNELLKTPSRNTPEPHFNTHNWLKGVTSRTRQIEVAVTLMW